LPEGGASLAPEGRRKTGGRGKLGTIGRGRLLGGSAKQGNCYLERDRKRSDKYFCIEKIGRVKERLAGLNYKSGLDRKKGKRKGAGNIKKVATIQTLTNRGRNRHRIRVPAAKGVTPS